MREGRRDRGKEGVWNRGGREERKTGKRENRMEWEKVLLFKALHRKWSDLRAVCVCWGEVEVVDRHMANIPDVCSMELGSA